MVNIRIQRFFILKGDLFMTSNMQLVKSAQFNGIQFDCYAQDEQQDISDFWATREQIGQLLEYAEPNNAITFIHKRNKERLDKFSTSVKLTQVEGNRTVYNFKGLLEICRYSNQLKANTVIDFLWEIADEIRRTGSYYNKEQYGITPNIINSARALLEGAGITGNQCTLALDKVYKSYTGRSLLLTTGIELEAPVKEQALTATQIAEELGIGKGKAGARFVNILLKNADYQRRVAGQWEPTKLGKPYAVMVDTNKRHSDGTPIRQPKWNSSILEVVKKLAQKMANAMNLAQAV